MIATARQEEFDLDFDAELPPNQSFFPVWQLAKMWRCGRQGTSIQHVINLIESGELKCPIDLRGKGSSKSMWRVPRASVVEFLNRRTFRP